MPGKQILIPVENLPENSTNIKGTFYISPAGELYLDPQMGYPTMVLRLEQGGRGVNQAIREISGPTTITADDYTVYATAGTFTQPLPSNPPKGNVFCVANIGSGVISVSATSINGEPTVDLNGNSSVMVQYTGITGTYIII